MSPFGLKVSQMTFHTETSKLNFVQLILSLCSFAQANTLTSTFNTLHTLLMCFFQFKFSSIMSIQIPRKDVDSTDSKSDS